MIKVKYRKDAGSAWQVKIFSCIEYANRFKNLMKHYDVETILEKD